MAAKFLKEQIESKSITGIKRAIEAAVSANLGSDHSLIKEGKKAINRISQNEKVCSILKRGDFEEIRKIRKSIRKFKTVFLIFKSFLKSLSPEIEKKIKAGYEIAKKRLLLGALKDAKSALTSQNIEKLDTLIKRLETHPKTASKVLPTLYETRKKLLTTEVESKTPDENGKTIENGNGEILAAKKHRLSSHNRISERTTKNGPETIKKSEKGIINSQKNAENDFLDRNNNTDASPSTKKCQVLKRDSVSLYKRDNFKFFIVKKMQSEGIVDAPGYILCSRKQ